MNAIDRMILFIGGSTATPQGNRAIAPPAKPIPPLCDDQRYLDEYEAKLHLVRDYTRGVALHYSTGFFLHGAGGISKSFTVLGELDRLGVRYRLFNSRMSGRGLFDTLARFPDAVHVLEDMERMTNDRDAQGVLRSATWSQKTKEGQQKRIVTWATARGVDSFLFTGGIIMLSNRPLDDLPELRAIKTRISYLELVVSDNEIAALMRKVAGTSFHHGPQVMTPEECLRVCEFLIAESKRRQCRLDLRLLDNSFRDYLQWRGGFSATAWQTMVATRLVAREDELAAAVPERQHGRHEDFACMEMALREHPTVQAAQEAWCRTRNKSRPTFFRVKKAFDARNRRA